MITTAGTTRASMGDEIYDYGASVVNGTIEDERFLYWCYEIDSREDYLDPEKWVCANPGIDVIKSREELSERVERSKSKSADVPGLLTKDFNYRTSIGTEAWLQYDEYHNDAKYDLERYRKKWCIGGCDLSKCGDLTSAAAVIYDPETDEFVVKCMSWIPESAFEEHIQQDKVPYDLWRNRGLVRVCPGGVVDTRMVTQWFNELVDDFGLNIHSIWFDAWSATTWVSEMEGWGYDMRPVRQGVRTLSLPMEHLGALFKEHRINYDGDSLFEWAVSNVTVFSDSNGMIKPNKQTNKRTGRKRRIDPLAAV
jgi:phage terminase large subunit-like protein